MTLIRKIKRKRSIAFLLVVCVICTLVPLNMWFIYSAYQSQSVVLDNAYNSIKNISAIRMDELAQRIRSINNYCYDLYTDGGAVFEIEQLERQPDFRSSDLTILMTYFSREVREHLSNYEDGDVFFFYYPKYDTGFIRTRGNMADFTSILTEWFSKEEHLSGTEGNSWKIQSIGNSFWIMHVNYWQGMYFGGCISMDQFLNNIKNDIGYGSTAVSMTAQPRYKEDEIGGLSFQCSYHPLYLNITVDQNEVLAGLPLIQRFSIAFSLCALVCIPLLILILHLSVLKPLKKVVYALNRLKSHPDTRIHGHAYTEEFNEVYNSFNNMAQEIVTLKIHNYEQTLERQKLELTSLQLQMNPHFLMNTFNLIFNLAQMKDFKNIQTMVLYLSDYFRYANAKNRTSTTVGEELELIKKYLEVASIQYINCFETRIEVDPALSEYEIPPLLLHNFVENFIKYGISLSKTDHLTITGRFADSKTVEFIIDDDGRGMPVETAEKMNQGIFEFKDGKTHLGIKNNMRRLEFIYGKSASIHIRSAPGKGMTVTILLPVNEKAAEICENTDTSASGSLEGK